MMRKKIAMVGVGLFVLACLAFIGFGMLYPGFEEQYQADADIFRLRHLEYYGGLIEEYHEATGAYPFEGESDVPIYAFVAHDRQIQYTEGGIPYEHERRTMAQFVTVLEEGLGREIEEYYDPQLYPSGRPNFYMYMVGGERYFFAVHLRERFSFSQPVAEGYNKIEISNGESNGDYAVFPGRLFESDEFRTAVAREVTRSGSMLQLEAEYLHFTKRSAAGGR